MAIPWDHYFLGICDAVSKRSKDENTKLGCVIADQRNRIVSTGYNSFPAGVLDEMWPNDRNCPIRFTKDGKEYEVTKYEVMAHAELNAIVSAGRPLIGCTLYCTYFPCVECAKAIITAGIKKIVYIKENPRFEKSCIIAKELFKQSGVEVWLVPNMD